MICSRGEPNDCSTFARIRKKFLLFIVEFLRGMFLFINGYKIRPVFLIT